MPGPAISTDKPVPPRQRSGDMYPVGSLGVGHSFAVPKGQRGSLCTAIQRHKVAHPGQQFTTRLEGATVRVWRTA